MAMADQEARNRLVAAMQRDDKPAMDLAIGDVSYLVWAVGEEKGSDFFYPKHNAVPSLSPFSYNFI